jgi:hypothetical protein
VAVIKARNVAPGVTSLHCPPAVNDALRDSPALWDQDSKSWLVQTNDLPQVTSWLEGQGHARPCTGHSSQLVTRPAATAASSWLQSCARCAQTGSWSR